MESLTPVALVEILQSPACLLSGAGGVVHLNAAWREHATLAGAGNERMPWAQLIWPEDRDAVLALFRSATMTGSRTGLECRLRDGRGEARWFLLDLQPLNEGADAECRWLCVGTDIHERKRKEIDLEKLASIQTDMLNISVDCIKLIALDGTLVHLNKAGCHALGVPEDSAFGMPWLPLLPEDVRKAGESALASARAGTFARFAGRSELPGRKVQHWDNMLTPVMNAADQPTAILCVSREVTAEREALESLRESGERQAIAARVGGLGIWDYDIRHDELRCDDAWYRIMGRDPARPIRSIAEFRPFIHPEDVDRATEVDRTATELIAEERDYAIEFRIVRPNGDIRWVRSAACLIQDAAGAAMRAVGFVVDITEAKIAEQKLRESHEALRQAERLARVGNWTWDIEADHAVWSEMLYEIFELDPARTAPQLEELREIFTPESFAAFLEVAEQCVTAGMPYSIDLEGIRPDGAHCFVNAKGEPVRDASGRIVQVRGTLADITERKNTENHMRALSERIQLAVEAGGVGIWEMDSATQTFLWDEQMHALYGLRPGEFEGSLDEWVSRIHPGDSAKILEDWKEAFAKNSTFEGEFRIAHPSAGIRYLRAQARIIRSPDGSPLRVIGTNWDVTPAREAEERLRAERYLLRTLIDHLPEVVSIVDREDRVRLTNPLIREYLGMPEDSEARGVKLHDFLPAESRRQLWEETVAVMESGIPVLNHVENVNYADGSERWVRTSKIPWRDPDGNVIGAILFSANITGERHAQQKIQEQAELLAEANAKLQEALSEAERHAQRAQASERAKAEFLAVMSHEIRTPMNSVLGMVRLALQTPLSPKQHNYLSKVDLSAKALVAIINDILDFSKIEAGGMTLESAEFSIESMLESVSAITAMRAEEKGLELVFDVAPGVPEWIVGDSLRVGQVLINLVNNAVKFTEQGEVVVSIGAEASGGPGIAVLRFAVRDTGMGLNAEQIGRLFRPFTQAEADVSRKFGGTGLGLTICKSLVEMMGGSIRVEGEPGRGCTFSFTIRAAHATSASATPDGKRVGLAGRRALIVDDNASAREILAQMVRRFDVAVEAAASGAEGLAALRQASNCGAPFEIVLMDWRMPEMDGLECARRIKADTGLRQTPAVLMVTACAHEEILRHAEQIRLEGILIKPVMESVMFNTLMEALGQMPDSPKSEDKRKKQDPVLLRGLRVLMADDNALNREVLAEFLQQLGLVVEAVEDGAGAVARLREKGDFDYVLLDMEMIGMNGVEAARLIREEPRFKKLPIVAMTGYADAEARRATREAGMDAHIAKPIHPDVLRDELLRLRPAVPGQAMLAGRRVLVVDDNALNREVAGDFLAAVGMETEFAASGREALVRLESADYDLVLMDMQMPEMGGIEATLAIRSQPRFSRLPIIALTAQAQESDREASFAAGMNAHLAKPIDEALLYRTIRQCLSVDAAPSPAVTESSGAPTPDFPSSLPGVDLRVAQARLGGSHDNVLRFLRGFARDFHSAPETLDRAFHAGDGKAIGLLGHTVKSLAAYIGAEELAAAAARLELAGKENRAENMAADVADFRRHIEIVLAGIAAHFPDEIPAAAHGEIAADHATVDSLLARAEPLVRKGSFDAAALLEEIRARLAGTPLAAQADALYEQYEDLELETAGETLENLRREILRGEKSP